MAKKDILKDLSDEIFKEPEKLFYDDYIKLDNIIKNLQNLIGAKQQKEKTKYIELVSKLDALSPLKTLTRGYSIVETENKIIKSVKELKTGDKIQIRLKDGKKEAQVI